jgi:hypothetical protein
MTGFNESELQIFAEARAAGDGLRRGFEVWVVIGRAVQIARDHADRPGGSHMAMGKRFRTILDDQKLGWIGRNDRSQILRMMAKLPAIRKWREELSEYQRIRWASPQSVINRCPACRPDGRGPKGPVTKVRPLSVSELMKMPAERAAQLLYDRCPSKAWAIRRSLDALLDAGRRRGCSPGGPQAEPRSRARSCRRPDAGGRNTDGEIHLRPTIEEIAVPQPLFQ